MIELNFREISILNVLLNKEFVAADELMRAGNISLRTLQAKLHFINDVLANEPYDIQIINQRGKGFSLEYAIDYAEQVEKLKRHCENYLNVTLNKRFGGNLRIPHICRSFFVGDPYIKIEDLASTLNVSIATVTKDMQEVRKFLELYDLHIQSTPYYGMTITGNELAIRSCMLDLLDVYDYSDETIFFEAGLEQYGLTKEDILSAMKQVKEVIYQVDYPLTDSGFQRIVKYLLITPMREVVSFEKEDLEQLSKLKEYEVAKLLIKEATPTEFCALAIFLMANSELEFISDPQQAKALLPEAQKSYESVLQYFHKHYQFDLTDHLDFLELLQAFLFKYQLRKKFHLTELEVLRSNKNLARKFSSSVALSCHIYFLLPERNEADFSDQLFYDFVMYIYALVYRLQNEYDLTNILIVSHNGKITKDILLKKLRLDTFRVKYHFAYVYELASLDFSKYDYALISKELNYNTEHIPIPALEFSFFFDDNFSSTLWRRIFISKRKIGPVTNYLIQPKIVEISGEIAEVIEQIADYLTELPDYQQEMSKTDFTFVIKTLLANANYADNSMIKYVNLFSTNEMHNRYFVFQLKKPITIKNRLVNSLQFIFLDGSKGLIEIKNGDSELRRYFRK